VTLLILVAGVATPACSQSKPESFTIAAVGDIIAAKPVSPTKGLEFEYVWEKLRSSDTGVGNLEEALIDFSHFDGYPEAENGGMWLVGAPQVAADLRALNIRMVARANNHSTEWSIAGMHQTDRLLDATGIVHAGTGDDRVAARAASYLRMPQGSVGLVSFASTFTASSVASSALGQAPARAGMSALRTYETHVVSQEMMDGLVKIRTAQRTVSGETGKVDEPNPVQEIELNGVSYKVGERVGTSTYAMNPTDISEIQVSIRRASGQADFVVATIHTHEPGNWSEQPPDFLVEAAHRAIDAGASVFVGHGPHQLRSIEIYRSKPIFYSLGDFVFQVEMQSPVPEEMYEAMKLDPAKSTDRELDEQFVKKYLDGPIWYQGAIAVTRFNHGTATEVELYPVELGFATQDEKRGTPRRPTPEVADTILKRLQRISQPFGTAIEIKDGVGHIRISPQT
jgi:poly-gamma-glutamate capsule biosynthesis protein CapA/YwtB (metallophosphatase superfamily)